MMRITVRLFAMLRQQAGWRERQIELPDGASVADAWRALVDVAPALASSREMTRFAVNRRYARPDDRLSEGDELALIPPVAGGSSSLLRLAISAHPIADELLVELSRSVPTDAEGALAIFVGRARETAGTPAPGEEDEAKRHADKPVIALEYEAFDEMALDVLRDIGAEIEQRFDVRRLAIIHRTGRVDVGQPSVVIAAAAAHRAAAFDACRYAIEQLKSRAPIWKSELYADGSVWIGAPAAAGPPPTTGEGSKS